MLKEDIKSLIKDVYSLFLYRICIVTVNTSNNIIIASVISGGIKSIGSYTNYSFLISAVNGILMQVFEPITASVGNLIAEVKAAAKKTTADINNRAHETFKALHFANFYLYGMCSAVLWIMLSPFVSWWLKGTDITFQSKTTIFLLILSFYLEGVQVSTTAFRNAYGLFKQGRYRPVVMAILNIIFSLFFVRKIGINGVFLGNILSRITTVSWFDPYIVHKHGFKKPLLPFIRNFIFQIFIIIVIAQVGEKILDLFPSDTLIWLFIRGILAVIIINVFLFLIYGRSKEFKFILERIKGLIKKITKK